MRLHGSLPSPVSHPSYAACRDQSAGIERLGVGSTHSPRFDSGATAPDPGNKLLIGKIRHLVREKGRITFAEFMEMALYDPEHGYYTSGHDRVGPRGDYLTSPAMHPVFGAMAGRWLAGNWAELGSPETFHIVEMGAGKGLLCASILSYLRDFLPELYSAAHYLVVEKSDPHPRETIARLCGPVTEELSHKLHVLSSLSELPDAGIIGCFLSNELADSFPVHLVTVAEGRLKEIYVTIDGDEFTEEIAEPSTPGIPRYFERLGIRLPEGYRTEVNLRAPDWTREVGAKLAKGFALTIDYGYRAEEYYSPERRGGTLVCYYRHAYSEHPYVRVGRQDITAHVDFTSLMDAGRAAGLETVFYTTQREFLLEQGIENWLRQMEKSDIPAQQKRSERRAVLALLDPRGMGRFRVLGQKKEMQRKAGFHRRLSTDSQLA